MAPEPDASVVIPTRNQSRRLLRCLLALADQTQAPATFEVVVVDEGSTDDTADVLASLATPFRLRALAASGDDGPVAARQAGARAAAGRLVIFLDDAAIAGPELVAEHVVAHRNAPDRLGIGRLTQVPPDRWYERQLAAQHGRRQESLERRPARWTDVSIDNLSVSRDAFLATGGSCETATATGDLELAYRLWRHGLVPVYLPRAAAQHDGGEGRAQLLADLQQQGADAAELAVRQPGSIPGALGWFGATSAREIVLRRLMISLGGPPVALARVGPLIPGSRRRQVWFEFVSQYAFWLGVRRTVNHRRWAQLTHGVPVLMYHAFAPTGDERRFIASRRRFALHMRVLAALRCRVISVTALAELLRENELPPPRAVAITIDDGYRDTLEIADPILARRGFPSTLFLVSRRLGAANDWDPEGELAGRPLLSREQSLRLRGRGVELGAHTRTHPTLPEITDAALNAEVAGSREDLERELGEPVTTFTYPYGRHDERAVAAARAAGFDAALTTEPRLARPGDDPMRIPRIEVLGTDSAWRFIRKLILGGA